MNFTWILCKFLFQLNIMQWQIYNMTLDPESWGGVQESVMSLQEEIVGTQEGIGINQLKIIYIIYPVHT